MEIDNTSNIAKTKNKSKSRTKQINISFNLDNADDFKLYSYLTSLENTSLTLKKIASEYQKKELDREEYTKDLIKEYMTTRDFNNNLKSSLKSSDMTNFFSKIIEETVVKEIKNYMKYAK